MSYRRGALDWALERLREHELHYQPHPKAWNRWSATCPACGRSGALTLTEYGDPLDDRPQAISLRCAGACPEDAITAALRAVPARIQEATALDLAAAASAIANRALCVARHLDQGTEPWLGQPT